MVELGQGGGPGWGDVCGVHTRCTGGLPSRMRPFCRYPMRSCVGRRPSSIQKVQTFGVSRPSAPLDKAIFYLLFCPVGPVFRHF